GENILIPVNDKNKKYAKAQGTYHIVEPKETLFGIAQKYGVTIQALQHSNKDILENGLQPGLELLIPTGKKAESSTTIIKGDAIIHVVQPKETKFSLLQKYGISEKELLDQNPQVKEGLKAGDTLRIVINNKITDDKGDLSQLGDVFETKDFKDLKIENTKKKEVVIMIPFRASKINNAQESFKTDRLLNIAVDWYSGA